MASDRGQNRYLDFVALQTLLRFENCSSSHCLLSSWRRFHVFESSHPSFHRTVFFGAPLAFLRGVALGLCRRCVIFMSSCRRVFLYILGRVLDVWGHILYRLYLHKLSLFCLVPCCSVTLLPCNLVTLLPCYSVILLLCYLVTPLPCYSHTLLLRYPVTLLPCYSVTLLPCFSVTLLLCYLVTLLSCYSVTFFPCYYVVIF